LGETQWITKSFQLQSTCTVQATGNGIWGYVSNTCSKSAFSKARALKRVL